mmetsp:Transcript_29033/g.76760  ORF Transcript_29033/g.76760 Transcript_29033/m.76760 type:complete len:211 (+) Transcript_29033:120-752(+)
MVSLSRLQHLSSASCAAEKGKAWGIEPLPRKRAEAEKGASLLFRCRHCKRLILEREPVYLRRDVPFCSTLCRQGGPLFTKREPEQPPAELQPEAPFCQRTTSLSAGLSALCEAPIHEDQDRIYSPKKPQRSGAESYKCAYKSGADSYGYDYVEKGMHMGVLDRLANVILRAFAHGVIKGFSLIHGDEPLFSEGALANFTHPAIIQDVLPI